MVTESITELKFDAEIFGKRGFFNLRVGEWEGACIKFYFDDQLFSNSGIIEFNAQVGSIQITKNHPYQEGLIPAGKEKDYFSTLIKGFINYYTFGWSPTKEKLVCYDGKYHEDNGYTAGQDNEVEIKTVQSKIIQRFVKDKKVLIAGCSAGELVRQCRHLNIQTYGFDIIKNIQSIAFPEIKEFVRTGSLTDIPFQQQDCFKTLVAIDVLEHIPEYDITKMVIEWNRLKIQQLILLINLNDAGFPGHITLRPLEWWAEQWKDHYRLTHTIRRFPDLPNVYSNDGDYNRQWTVWEKLSS